MLRNFIYEVCGCNGGWRMADFMELQCRALPDIVGDHRVICGLSGGVDSSVVAALLHRAIGDKLTCIFVDNGLLRKNERELVERTFRDTCDIDLRVIDASKAFLDDLKGVTDPQEKRRLIGHRFIDVFQQAADDVVKDGGPPREVPGAGHAVPRCHRVGGRGTPARPPTSSSHHNVGGLPDDMSFELIEPLRDLFKDEVRALGERCSGSGRSSVGRHPFPGPGLAVRLLGEIDEGRLYILRECDEIVLEEIIAANLYKATQQVFAVLLPVRSVGVMGDSRTYDSVVAVRGRGHAGLHDPPTGRAFHTTCSQRSAIASSTKSTVSTVWSTTSRASRPRPSSGNETPPGRTFGEQGTGDQESGACRSGA